MAGKKDYLIQAFQGFDILAKAKAGDVIQFEMPPFCSGDYKAVIKKDKFGLYIDKDDNFLEGCRDFRLVKKS